MRGKTCHKLNKIAREGIFRYRTLEYDELGYILCNSF